MDPLHSIHTGNDNNDPEKALGARGRKRERGGEKIHARTRSEEISDFRIELVRESSFQILLTVKGKMKDFFRALQGYERHSFPFQERDQKCKSGGGGE